MDFAERASQACAEKNAWFDEYLFKRSKEHKKIFYAKKLAERYFVKQKKYQKALPSYFFLKNKARKPEEKAFYSLRIATIFFELGFWKQSLIEIKNQLQIPFLNSERKMDFLFLKSRVLLMQAEYDLAEKIFYQIKKQDPSYFAQHKIFLYLSLIHESQKNFHQAIMELELFKDSSSFLLEKIGRLKLRQKNQPGIISF